MTGRVAERAAGISEVRISNADIFMALMNSTASVLWGIRVVMARISWCFKVLSCCTCIW